MQMRNHSLIASAAAAAAVALGAAGCSFQPKYEQPAPPVAGAFPSSGVYATQPAATPGRSAAGQAAADIGWRDFLADQRLQRLVDIALANNRDLRVTMLNVDSARAQYRVARAALFPSLDATAEKSVSRTPKNLSFLGQTISNKYSVGLDTSWEIDFWGRIRSLKDQALEKYLSTAQARKAAEISLVSQVADQYLQMLADDELLKVTDDTLRSALDQYNLTKLQFDNGTGSELDLRQAETVVEQARANRESEARLRAQAENALVLLIGQPLPADLPPGRPLGDQALLTDIPAGLPSDLLTRRPDIMEAEATLRAANANIGAARAAFLPKISLTGSFGTASPTLGGFSSRARRPGPLHRKSRCRSSKADRTSPISIWRISKSASRLRTTRKRSNRRFARCPMGLLRAAPTMPRSVRSSAIRMHCSERSICRNCATAMAWIATCRCSQRKRASIRRSSR